LTRSTVLDICARLATAGWIEELDDARIAGQYQLGRPARRYRLRARHGHVVAVDAAEQRISAAVADLNGTELARAAGPALDAETPAEQRRTAVQAAVRAALAEAGTGAEEVLVTVIAVPAPVDDAGHSPVGEGYWEKVNPQLGSVLTGHAAVLVENDANLAALAEQARGAGQGAPCSATLLAGERFGAGLIVDGRLIRGSRGGAGELRLLEVVRGVGTTLGLGALARDRARKLLADGRIPASSPLAELDADRLTAEAVFDAASAGDRTAGRILGGLGDRLARIAQVLGSLLDVDRVIVAGTLADAAGPVIDRARTVLQRDFYPPVPDLVASTLGADVVLLGALERGLAEIRARPLESAERVGVAGAGAERVPAAQASGGASRSR